MLTRRTQSPRRAWKSGYRIAHSPQSCQSVPLRKTTDQIVRFREPLVLPPRWLLSLALWRRRGGRPRSPLLSCNTWAILDNRLRQKTHQRRPTLIDAEIHMAEILSLEFGTEWVFVFCIMVVLGKSRSRSPPGSASRVVQLAAGFTFFEEHVRIALHFIRTNFFSDVPPAGSKLV